jgi:hypothetical protein
MITTVSLTAISIWNLVEVQVGIMAACGPTLRVILSHMLPTETIMSLISLIGRSSRPSSKGSASKEDISAAAKNSGDSFSKLPSETSVKVQQYHLAVKTVPLRADDRV